MTETHTSHPFRRYGSGYPDNTTEGVKGRSFPFFFFPISYGRYPGYGPTYIFDHEYGLPDNKRRPGGSLYYVVIRPPKSLTAGLYPELLPTTRLFVIADKPTLKYIKRVIRLSYSNRNLTGWPSHGTERVRVSKPIKFKGPAEDPSGPAPEQAVVYYRGSSVVLSLLAYNNTAQLVDYTPQNPSSLIDTPLPHVASTRFFQCINSTLGESIPLVVSTDTVPYHTNAAPPPTTPQQGFAMLLMLALVIWRAVF